VRRFTLLALLAAALASPGGARAAGGTVSIFFYPWYGSAAADGSYLHWQQAGHTPPTDIASSFYPLRGLYSSGQKKVLAGQMAEIAHAGIDQVVSSWWGWGSIEDQRLPAIIAAATRRHLSVAVQIEPYDGRTAESVAADVGHLRTLGITEFYVYAPQDVPDADWAALNDSLQGQVRLYAQTALAGRAAAGHFAGLYTYDVLTYGGADFARICTEVHALQLACLPSVGPGFDSARATGDPRVRPRRDGRTYDTMWQGAIRSGADGITITSYNEWHEGTQIEPAVAVPSSAGFGYAGYAGAWGIDDARSSTAYLDRTAYWAARFRMQRVSASTSLRQ
jgi:hypothetical protein